MKKFNEENMSKAFHNEDSYMKLCEESVASDFYFHVADVDDFTQIYLVPKDYFDDEKYMWDQSMNLDHILPSDKFAESMEMVWESEDSAEQVRDWMLSQGFVSNIEFTKLVEAEHN